MTVTLSPEQTRALDSIRGFLASGSKQSFTLHGLAGSGKTTVLARVAEQHQNAILCTLTGKAASVLRDKTGLPACTIHSAFYKLKEILKDKKGKRHMQWDDVYGYGELRGGVILMDECSMVNDGIAQDMLKTGAKIIACGDPGQLPPVTGKQFFDRPDCTLQEIHRQALESPIIRQAHAVRNGKPYAADGAFRVASVATDADLLDADVILTWTHKTRKAANAEMRRLKGFWMPQVQEGEPVMCLRNVPTLGIYNGAVYPVTRKISEGDKTIYIEVDGLEVPVPGATFEGLRLANNNTETAVPFDFGYAMTVHKAQGSEWLKVILIDEYRRPEDRARWLYTGITRAADTILVVR